eukprot:30662_1
MSAIIEEEKKDKELKHHGGQEWKLLTNFVEDFSVTTNSLSTPQSGIKAIKESIVNIDHYPSLDNEPALTDLATFIWGNNKTEKQIEQLKSTLVLGNGASELVDITMRVCAENNVKSFRGGPSKIQYKDYERCARLNKFKILQSNDDSADLLSMVNPTNPTGDFMTLETMKAYIENHASDNSFVIVDESMIFWYGSDWRSQSLSSQTEWINNMYKKHKISIFLIYSWTKIWKCCGIRIGSIISPQANSKLYSQIKTKQTPWSVNLLGLSFISMVAKDNMYMKQTWKYTKIWRKEMVDEMYKIFNDKESEASSGCIEIKLYGTDFLSWIWCDTFNKELQQLCVKYCKEYGVPIRDASHGYNQFTCIRFAVRSESAQK